MSKYKLVAVDMDGTLLDDNKNISSNTINAINAIIAKGIVFVISTGRPYAGVKKYFEMIDGSIPLILYNGAVVSFSKEDNVLYNCKLSSASSKKIIDIINYHHGTFIFWSNEKLYINKVNDYTDFYLTISNVKPVLIDENTVIPYDDITKIIWIEENEKLVDFQKNNEYDLSDVSFFTSQPIFLEFVNKGISKAKALEAIGNYYHINASEMIAIGDGYNDLAMIEYAGLGVAMENGETGVKQKANYITSSNEDEGVLKVINKFILND